MGREAVHAKAAKLESGKVMDSYTIISYKAKDLPKEYTALVYSKWLRSFRHGNKHFKHIHSGAFYKQYHDQVENLLSKPDATIRLAVLSDDHDVVLGFCATREDVLDYVHVHKDYRRIGIAKSLVPEGIKAMTHMTDLALKIWGKNKNYQELKFNPKI